MQEHTSDDKNSRHSTACTPPKFKCNTKIPYGICITRNKASQLETQEWNNHTSITLIITHKHLFPSSQLVFCRARGDFISNTELEVGVVRRHKLDSTSIQHRFDIDFSAIRVCGSQWNWYQFEYICCRLTSTFRAPVVGPKSPFCIPEKYRGHSPLVVITAPRRSPNDSHSPRHI